MPNKVKAPIHEHITETLYGRAEEIFLLCAILTRRKLAHAFCNLSGHVDQLDSQIHPIDSNYMAQSETPAIAKLRVTLRPYEFLSLDAQERSFNKSMEEMNTYISYLGYLIERNEPVTTAKQESAA